MSAPTLDQVDGIDWALVSLPPATAPVRAGADCPARVARVTCAYYDPEHRCPDPEHPERERRTAGGQVVLVAADGTVVATWRTGAKPAVTRGRRVVERLAGPTDQSALLGALTFEGIGWCPARRHVRVETPVGVAVYIASAPAGPREVINTVALLRRHGCTLSYRR